MQKLLYITNGDQIPKWHLMTSFKLNQLVKETKF